MPITQSRLSALVNATRAIYSSYNQALKFAQSCEQSPPPNINPAAFSIIVEFLLRNSPPQSALDILTKEEIATSPKKYTINEKAAIRQARFRQRHTIVANTTITNAIANNTKATTVDNTETLPIADSGAAERATGDHADRQATTLPDVPTARVTYDVALAASWRDEPTPTLDEWDTAPD